MKTIEEVLEKYCTVERASQHVFRCVTKAEARFKGAKMVCIREEVKDLIMYSIVYKADHAICFLLPLIEIVHDIGEPRFHDITEDEVTWTWWFKKDGNALFS